MIGSLRARLGLAFIKIGSWIDGGAFIAWSYDEGVRSERARIHRGILPHLKGGSAMKKMHRRAQFAEGRLARTVASLEFAERYEKGPFVGMNTADIGRDMWRAFGHEALKEARRGCPAERKQENEK